MTVLEKYGPKKNARKAGGTTNKTGGVNMADDNKGILSFKLFVRLILVSTSDGNISEYFGVNVTSSNVSASFIGTMIIYIRFL